MTTTSSAKPKGRKKKLVTQCAVIVDRSGSMSAIETEARQALNAWLKDQAQVTTDELRTTITLFDHEIITPFRSVPVGDIPAFTKNTYVPRGTTALYDAVGLTVRQCEKDGGDRYLVVILTDGQENASKEWTRAMVLDLVTEKEASGDWTFVYLSAGPNAFSDAAVIGIKAGSTFHFDATSSGTHTAGQAVSHGTTAYRGQHTNSAGGQAMSTVINNTINNTPTPAPPAPRKGSRKVTDVPLDPKGKGKAR